MLTVRLEPEDSAKFGLMINDIGEWLFLSPDIKIIKILPSGHFSKYKEGVCSITLYQVNMVTIIINILDKIRIRNRLLYRHHLWFWIIECQSLV